MKFTNKKFALATTLVDTPICCAISNIEYPSSFSWYNLLIVFLACMGHVRPADTVVLHHGDLNF